MYVEFTRAVSMDRKKIYKEHNISHEKITTKINSFTKKETHQVTFFDLITIHAVCSNSKTGT